MAFNWRDYLELAHDLRKDPRESAQRASLGRSYYFAYNLGLTTARNLSFQGQLPGLHGKLWMWCVRHQNREIRKLGNLGNSLQSKRTEADYLDAPIPNLTGDVQIQLNRARQFEEIVARLTQTPAPPPFL